MFVSFFMHQIDPVSCITCEDLFYSLWTHLFGSIFFFSLNIYSFSLFALACLFRFIVKTRQQQQEYMTYFYFTRIHIEWIWKRNKIFFIKIPHLILFHFKFKKAIYWEINKTSKGLRRQLAMARMSCDLIISITMTCIIIHRCNAIDQQNHE